IPVAITLALGFVIGGYIGGKIAVSLDNETLRRVFGIILFIMSLHIIFSK
ncbi:MAG: sulfite exporter TauE/SafE family protein, partial [Spirochaetes bacterium]|nr:sulfite exporter TauE/SafE family protein [Spirochaetota bacterium]